VRTIAGAGQPSPKDLEERATSALLRIRIRDKAFDRQIVVHSDTLGFEVACRVLRRRNDDRHTANYRNAELTKRTYLRGIVGQEPDARDPEVLQHVARDVVAARVVREPEKAICVHGVMAMRLKSVRTNLVGETYAAPLLPQIENRAHAGAPDCRERGVELVFAVAFQRTEDLSGDAFGMNAYENVLSCADLPPHESYVLWRGVGGPGRAAHRAAKHMRFEFAVARWNPGFRQALGQKPLRPDHPLGDVHLNSVFFFAKSRYRWRWSRAAYTLKPKGE
jgi:hypothetical protein